MRRATGRLALLSVAAAWAALTAGPARADAEADCAAGAAHCVDLVEIEQDRYAAETDQEPTPWEKRLGQVESVFGFKAPVYLMAAPSARSSLAYVVLKSSGASEDQIHIPAGFFDRVSAFEPEQRGRLFDVIVLRQMAALYQSRQGVEALSGRSREAEQRADLYAEFMTGYALARGWAVGTAEAAIQPYATASLYASRPVERRRRRNDEAEEKRKDAIETLLSDGVKFAAATPEADLAAASDAALRAVEAYLARPEPKETPEAPAQKPNETSGDDDPAEAPKE